MHAHPDHNCQTSEWLFLNCDSCLTEKRVRTGYHIVRTVDWSSLSWNWERNQKLIEYWEATGHAAETFGRMHAGTKPSRYSMGSDGINTSSGQMILVCLASWRDDTSSGHMEQWTDERPDGMARSSGRLTGNLNSSDLQTLNSGIPGYSIFTLKWFCPKTEWG
jgi:hypothetical protein